MSRSFVVSFVTQRTPQAKINITETTDGFTDGTKSKSRWDFDELKGFIFFNSIGTIVFYKHPKRDFLVENIWNSQSVLSAQEDLFDLILVRWDKYEEWCPWNCILLIKEEASAHAKLENVTEVRLLFFVCLCCFKAIVNRWVWGRCLSKLRKPQASVKVTKTTLWASPTRHRNTENLSGNFLPTPIQRDGRAGNKKALTQAQAKTTHAKWLDHQRSAVKMLGPWKSLKAAPHTIRTETAGQHCLVFNLT